MAAGVSLDAGGVRVAVLRDGHAEPVAVGGESVLPVASAWEGDLPPERPAARGWVGCFGQAAPLAFVGGRPVTARDVWGRLLRRVRAALEGAGAGQPPGPLALAVPAAQAWRVRAHNDHLAAAWEAGFPTAHVVAAAVAVACQHDAAGPVPGERPVLVVEARPDALELTALVKAGGRWALAAPPRVLPRLGTQAAVRGLVSRVLAEFPPRSRGDGAFLGALAGLELDLDGASRKVSRDGPADVPVRYALERPRAAALFTVTADLVGELLGPDLPALRGAAVEVCADLRVAPDDLAAVLTAGAGFRWTALARAVRDCFGPTVREAPDPEWVAALGAARWAARPHPPAVFGEPSPLRRADPRRLPGPGGPDDSPGWVRLSVVLPLSATAAGWDGWAADLGAWGAGLPLGLRVGVAGPGLCLLLADLPGAPGPDLVRAFQVLLAGYRDWLLGKAAEPRVPPLAPVDAAHWQTTLDAVLAVARRRGWVTERGHVQAGPSRIRVAGPGRPPLDVVRDGAVLRLEAALGPSHPVRDEDLLRANAGLTGVAAVRGAGGLAVRGVVHGGHLGRTDLEAVAEAVMTTAEDLPRQLRPGDATMLIG